MGQEKILHRSFVNALNYLWISSYGFEEKFSLSRMFQRLDNFMETGLEKSFNSQRISAEREIAEINTVTAALGQEFPQKEELALTRDNHSAIIRELQRVQDDAGYVGEWRVKTTLIEEKSMEESYLNSMPRFKSL